MAMLDSETNIGYLLGRLFAKSEQAISLATGDSGLDLATRSRFWGRVAQSPRQVYKEMLDACLEALASLRDRGLALRLDRDIQSIVAMMQGIPPRELSEDESDLFSVGYYQQRAADQHEGLLHPEQAPVVADRGEIAGWFDPDEFLGELKKVVNVLYGNRWVAFSMPGTGQEPPVVYVQVPTVIETIRRIGKLKRSLSLDSIDGDEDLRSIILEPALKFLSEERQVLAAHLLDGTYTPTFTVKMSDRREYANRAFVPFLAEALGEPSHFESAKYGRVAGIVAVVPERRGAGVRAAEMKAKEVGFSKKWSGAREMKPRDAALESFVPSGMVGAIPLEWFSPGEFLEAARPLVNRMFGSRWLAFSCDEIVYIHTATVMDIIADIGSHHMAEEVLDADKDPWQRKALVYTAVHCLKEIGAAVVELLDDGYYCGYFNVTMANGDEYRRCSFVPLRLSSFSDPGQLEATKTGRLLDIRSVSRYRG